MPLPCPVPRCRVSCSGLRHRHPFDPANTDHVTCTCGAQEWWISYGGPLPMLITCGKCGQSFNLSERLTRLGERRGRPRV